MVSSMDICRSKKLAFISTHMSVAEGLKPVFALKDKLYSVLKTTCPTGIINVFFLALVPSAGCMIKHIHLARVQGKFHQVQLAVGCIVRVNVLIKGLKCPSLLPYTCHFTSYL